MDGESTVEQPLVSGKGNGRSEEVHYETGSLVTPMNRGSSSTVSTIFEDIDVPVIDHGELEHHWDNGELNRSQGVEAATAKLFAIVIRLVGEDLSCTDKCRVLERATEELQNGLSTRRQAAFPANRGSAVESTNTPILHRSNSSADWCEETRGIDQSTSQRADAVTQEVDAQCSRDEVSASGSEEGSQLASPSPKQDTTWLPYSEDQDHSKQRHLNSIPKDELVCNWLRRLPIRAEANVE